MRARIRDFKQKTLTKHKNMKAKCSGITLVEAVISTIILAFIAQILVYGFQFVNSQSSAILSKNVQVRDDANSCMEYMLRTLNKRDYQTKKITSEDIAACKEQCKRLTGRDNIEIQADGSDVQLFPDQKIKGYWLTITVKGNSSNTTYAPSAVRDYTVRTLATYYDAAASTSASYAGNRHGRRTLDYGQHNVVRCDTYRNYLNRHIEIPLSPEQLSVMRIQCKELLHSSDVVNYGTVGFMKLWNITRLPFRLATASAKSANMSEALAKMSKVWADDVSFLEIPPVWFTKDMLTKQTLTFRKIRRGVINLYHKVSGAFSKKAGQ